MKMTKPVQPSKNMGKYMQTVVEETISAAVNSWISIDKDGHEYLDQEDIQDLKEHLVELVNQQLSVIFSKMRTKAHSYLDQITEESYECISEKDPTQKHINICKVVGRIRDEVDTLEDDVILDENYRLSSRRGAEIFEGPDSTLFKAFEEAMISAGVEAQKKQNELLNEYDEKYVRSDCCNEKVKTVGSDEGTYHWECTGCNLPCNVLVRAVANND